MMLTQITVFKSFLTNTNFDNIFALDKRKHSPIIKLLPGFPPVPIIT